MSERTRISLLLAFLASGVVVSACYNWAPTDVPSTAGQLAGNPHQAKVTRTDGTSVTLRDPAVGADSLFGFRYVRGEGSVRVAIAKADIKDVNASSFSGTKTFGAVVGVGAAALFALYLALQHGTIGDGCRPAIC